MGTIAEHAKAYEPQQTKNISDLPEVNTQLELKTEKYTDKDGKEFSVEVFEHEGEKYRCPTSVLKSLKAIMEERPNLLKFKVIKTGTGLATEYTVVPLE